MRKWTQAIIEGEVSEAEAVALLKQECLISNASESRLLQAGLETPAALGRVLRLLSVVSDGQRLVPTLLPMLKARVPEVREHAALLIARGRPKSMLLGDLLTDPDPRVRADIVEAFSRWTLDKHLLTRAVADEHHRVFGSGVVGLYRLKQKRAMELLEQNLQHENWLFRAATTWACGAIGDPALAPLVQRMRSDPHPSVRWNALRATSALFRAPVPKAQDRVLAPAGVK